MKNKEDKHIFEMSNVRFSFDGGKTWVNPGEHELQYSDTIELSKHNKIDMTGTISLEASLTKKQRRFFKKLFKEIKHSKWCIVEASCAICGKVYQVSML